MPEVPPQGWNPTPAAAPKVKSLGVVALALLCIGLFAFAVRNVLTTSREWENWSADTTRLFTAIEVERMIQDSTKPLKAELARVTAEGRKVAERNRRTREGLLGERDSLSIALSHSQSAPESLLIARRTNEVLDSAIGVASREIEALESVIGGQAQMIGILKMENVRAWNIIDSASGVIRRVPQPCRIPVVGIKCPTVVVGGVVTRQGLDVGVAFGFPL